MNKLLNIFAAVLISFFSFGQTPTTIVLSPKLNYEGKLNCTSQTLIYVDSLSKKTIQEANQQRFLTLTDFQFDQFSFYYFKYTFWLKLSLENPSSDSVKVLFDVSTHKRIEVYEVVDAANFRLLNSTSDDLLISQRQYPYDEKYVPLSFIPKKRYDLLIKITEHPQLFFKIQPQLLSYGYEYQDKVRAFYDEYFTLVLDGFYVSILLFVVLFALIFYAIDRRIYYLHYAGYVGSILIFSLWGIEHSPYIEVFHSFIPFLKFSGNNNTYVLIANIFYGSFLLTFLNLEKRSPKFARLLIRFRILIIIVWIADTIVNFILKNHTLGGFVWLITQPLVVVMSFMVLFQLFKLKSKLSRYIKFGTTALCIGVVLGFGEQLLQLKPTDRVIMRFTPSIPFNFGVLIEIFFFSLAIGFKTWQVQRERIILLKAMRESELKTVRSQINPHFVFNSLNSIKSFILTNRSLDASEYLTDFSSLMRSILQHSKEKLISLTDELETTNLYVKLEKLRFEDSFDYQYSCDESIDTESIMIPPMLLQPYIENAIKHGLMNLDGMRVLKLEVLRKAEPHNQILEIIIDDNGIGREAASIISKNSLKHKSMGMSINRERIKLLNLTNDVKIQIQIIDKKDKNGLAEGTRVIIKIPIEE
ncbi:MAG: histidine kinase [Spirosomataceae bacterium]